MKEATKNELDAIERLIDEIKAMADSPARAEKAREAARRLSKVFEDIVFEFGLGGDATRA